MSDTPRTDEFRTRLPDGRFSDDMSEALFLFVQMEREIESLKSQLANIRQENVLYSADAQRIRWLVKPEEHEELFEAVDRALAECRDKALEVAALACESYAIEVCGKVFRTGSKNCATAVRSLKGENHDPE